MRLLFVFAEPVHCAMSQPRRDTSELDDGPSLIELDLSVPADSPSEEQEEGDFVPFSPSDHGSTVGLGFGRGSLLQTSGLYASRSTSMNIIGSPGAGAIPLGTSLPYASAFGGGMSLGSTPLPLLLTMPAAAGSATAGEVKGNGAAPSSPASSKRSLGALPPLRGDASYQILPDDRERANVRRGMKSMSIEIRAIAPYWFKLVKKNAQEANTDSARDPSCCTRLLSWSLLQRVSQHRLYVFFLLFSVVWFSLMESTEDLVVQLHWAWLLLFSWFIPFTFIAYLVSAGSTRARARFSVR